MESMTNDKLDYLMVSKSNDLRISGKIYLYDVYTRPESENVRLNFTKLPNNADLVERITLQVVGSNDKIIINDKKNYIYLLYRESSEINLIDEENLFKSFKDQFAKSFKRDRWKSDEVFRYKWVLYKCNISEGYNNSILVFVPEAEEDYEEL